MLKLQYTVTSWWPSNHTPVLLCCSSLYYNRISLVRFVVFFYDWFTANSTRHILVSVPLLHDSCVFTSPIIQRVKSVSETLVLQLSAWERRPPSLALYLEAVGKDEETHQMLYSTINLCLVRRKEALWLNVREIRFHNIVVEKKIAAALNHVLGIGFLYWR